MKKLLAAVLMFSFCTTDAGIIQKMKNVKTKVSTKLGLTKLGSKKQPDQIDNWLTNVQDIVSKIIPDVQAILNDATNEQIQTDASNLNTLLNECMKDPFIVINKKDNIDQCIESLKKQKVNVTQLSADYSSLSNVITEYKKGYNDNLNNMISAVTSVQKGWEKDSETLNIANQLSTLLNACKDDTTKVSGNLDAIQQCITQLSGELGSSHTFITNLNNGATYLKTHVEWQQRSQALSSPKKTAAENIQVVNNQLNTFANTINNKMDSTKDTSNSKSAAIINAIDAAKKVVQKAGSKTDATNAGN